MQEKLHNVLRFLNYYYIQKNKTRQNTPCWENYLTCSDFKFLFLNEKVRIEKYNRVGLLYWISQRLAIDVYT